MTPESVNKNHPRVAILGVRGVPAAHGGFETFAARLAPFLASTGWNVSVYCQEDEPPEGLKTAGSVWHSDWESIDRVHIAVGPDTPMASIRFDWACISHVLKNRPNVVLILGYNTALFSLRLRMAGIPTVINMDGLEWQRAKWSIPAKAWLYANERAGCLTANHLIADHPHIKRHLRTRVSPRKITVIPYGTDSADEADTDRGTLSQFGLERHTFATLIARPEPENSILEMVAAFSSKPRGIRLVVLGNYRPELFDYHAKVRAAASEEVLFLGPVYEKERIEPLRRGSLFYLHGHQVGGCNPSLLEAMGAGNPVLAHDNRFNRWVVRDGALYFSDETSFERALEEFLGDRTRLAMRGENSRRRARTVFHWPGILQSYSDLLTDLSTAEADDEMDLVWLRRPYWRIHSDAQ